MRVKGDMDIILNPAGVKDLAQTLRQGLRVTKAEAHDGILPPCDNPPQVDVADHITIIDI